MTFLRIIMDYTMMLLIMADQLVGLRTRMKPQQMMMIPDSFMPEKMTLC